MSYETFNQPIKKTCWEISEKYAKLYPDLSDALCACIKDEINDDHLAVIRMYEYSDLLDPEDTKKFKNAMDWYYDYVAQCGAEEAYYNSAEYKEQESERWANERF